MASNGIWNLNSDLNFPTHLDITWKWIMKSLSFDGVCYAMYVCMKYVRDSYFQNRWQSSPSPKWSLQNAMASLMIGKNYTSSLSLLPFLQNRIKKKKGIKFGWHGSHPKGYNIQETKHPASSPHHYGFFNSPLFVQSDFLCLAASRGLSCLANIH